MIRKLDALIFTKDRACQLDLLLRSMEKNCPLFNYIIICKSSTYDYSKGYEKVMKKYKGYWILESLSNSWSPSGYGIKGDFLY